MKNSYEQWWHKGQEDDDTMARDHHDSWDRTIDVIAKEDIIGKTILDFGCNQGGFLRQLYQKVPFKQGVGIDLARKSLQKAELLKGDLPLSYVLTDMPSDTGLQFDTAISTSVLYLIDDIPQHAKELKRVLKPQGVYYATFADLTDNPSCDYMAQVINTYGATPSQNHSLKHIVDSFVQEGFQVSVKREMVPDEIDLTHYSDFYLSPSDYLRTLFQESYVIKATVKEG
ncbi:MULTISPECIES: bifunctional 2-polyprenyl-6-hydroxyphenol methylase/3-demethylubiquinol 3-O-methyltransferase UbiG [Staphylococcus]|uniref:class I SAM-dependent methyltransferase n=1 Tax=Staphylococcus TaxID=1279 RepID=UPI00076B604E|nr:MULTISPECIES: class I SAM-dependent methyltransferase [Staphylococcus]AMG64251.1 SAM-dependent methyltransferase [Staphylococcus lugdunensis]MCI2814433.1 class I SAM-dependent methyltransferase [Staphylococcus lugdunensis]MDU0965925.1 class I SAM-dependent methyltransferase [Staphylococcus lugdunensis]MDU1963616.1 class I SAM-dependent methyltransferase [Staphylococcus lugdunensis]MDU2321370.1 class I SAM-dependent methyltransferase [Staphylococcus lugdunensis]